MIYITGDTHGDLSHFKDPKLKRLGEKDIVIVCGDFGFLWNPNDSKEKRNLEWLKKRKYTICFLDGAHENFDMLDSYTPYRWKGGNTHKIADNIYHLMRGEMFMFENKTFFVMGGGESEDKDMREDGVSWWKAELPTAEDLKNGQDNLREYKYAEQLCAHLRGSGHCQGLLKAAHQQRRAHYPAEHLLARADEAGGVYALVLWQPAHRPGGQQKNDRRV